MPAETVGTDDAVTDAVGDGAATPQRARTTARKGSRPDLFEWRLRNISTLPRPAGLTGFRRF
jgi:hypothetical protein